MHERARASGRPCPFPSIRSCCAASVALGSARIRFGVMSAQEMARVSHLRVFNRDLYAMPGRTPAAYGVLDRRLGVSDKGGACETCRRGWPTVRATFATSSWLPVYHVGFIAVVTILQNACKARGVAARVQRGAQ